MSLYLSVLDNVNKFNIDSKILFYNNLSVFFRSIKEFDLYKEINEFLIKLIGTNNISNQIKACVYWNKAYICLQENNLDDTFKYLDLCIKNDKVTNLKDIMESDDFNSIKKDKRFIEIINRYK